MYTPILRNRRSEILGLKELPESLRKHVTPLFDVAAPTKGADRAKAETYVAANIARTAVHAKGFGAVFVDSSELDAGFRLPNTVHPLTAAAFAIAGANVKPVPVTGLHRDDAHNGAVMEVMAAHGPAFCLRLDATDVGTANSTLNSIRSFLRSRKAIPDQVYLLLDMQCLHARNPDDVLDPINRFLALVNDERWAGIVIGGYGMPDQLSTAVQTNEQAYLPRIEQTIFNSLDASGLRSPVWFADYTILSPSVVELDWRLISRVMTPKALYALDDTWLVVRGSAFSSHPDGYAQYYDIAANIVALDEYAGEGYSAGDKYISERARRVGKSGSPASWITACVNHHVTVTARAHARIG